MSDTADEAQAREERFRAESLARVGIMPRPLVIPPPHYDDPSPKDQKIQEKKRG